MSDLPASTLCPFLSLSFTKVSIPLTMENSVSSGNVSMHGGLGGGVWRSGRVAVGVASISRRQVSGGSSRDTAADSVHIQASQPGEALYAIILQTTHKQIMQ